MLYFGLKINNPFSRGNFKNLFSRTWNIAGHRYLEFEIYKIDQLIEIEFVVEWKGSDHAGPHITIGLLGREVSLLLYDNRHWNYETNDWEVYEESKSN